MRSKHSWNAADGQSSDRNHTGDTVTIHLLRSSPYVSVQT